MISNRIFVAAVAMLAWIAAGAQKRLTMQECIDMAVKNNYGIRAAEGEVEKSQLMQGSAWDLDKTSLSLKQDPTKRFAVMSPLFAATRSATICSSVSPSK